MGYVRKFRVSEMKIDLNQYRRSNSLKIMLNPSTGSGTAKWRFGPGHLLGPRIELCCWYSITGWLRIRPSAE
eukprot:COSAG02_NODE_3159_length_7255_cov_15.875629_4_plen_72_part_00